MEKKNFKVSVVIPIFNEEENLPALTNRLDAVLSQYQSYEVIYVNDGSKDRSREIIRDQAKENTSIKTIELSRNFGHQEAISAGLGFASGDAVIVMDGDLQDPPEVLPLFINKWLEGNDVVYAVRKKRKENIFKKAAYFSFYRILKALSSIDIPLDSGDFSLMDKKVVAKLRQLPERNRFVRGIRSWVGFKQVGLEYERHARNAGEPKYTVGKLFLLAYNGIISFSTTPIKIASYLGALFTGVAFCGVLWVLYHKFVLESEIYQGWASTILVLFFMSGIQLVIAGIQGEYIARIYTEVKGSPNFVVGDTVGFEENNNVVSLDEKKKDVA